MDSRLVFLRPLGLRLAWRQTGDGAHFEALAGRLKIISHPVRLQIVTGLLDASCCVKDIWGCLGLPQATVSQHLAALRAHGIVRGRREGNSITYEVVDPFVKELVHFLSEVPHGQSQRG